MVLGFLDGYQLATSFISYAVGYGIALGGVYVPLIWLDVWVCGIIFTAIAPFLWLPLAAVIQMIIFAIGMFLSIFIMIFIGDWLAQVFLAFFEWLRPHLDWLIAHIVPGERGMNAEAARG